MSTKPPPARLYVILARKAPLGVIFRRGPSKLVQLIKWNTEDDTFEPGQWLKGRVYEHRCDLSPDGRLLAYFCSKYTGRARLEREVSVTGANVSREYLLRDLYTYAWTAISRPPYFTALALWPKGDCWDGGGLFETDRVLWLNHPAEMSTPHPSHVPQGLRVHAERGGGEDYPIWSRRMTRDGWKLVTELSGEWIKPCRGWPFGWYRTIAPEVWERSNKTSDQLLRMMRSTRHFANHFRFEVQTQTGIVRRVPADRWADWDRRGRLVYVRRGALFVATVSPDGTLSERQLADFNANTFEPVETPVWAQAW